MSEFQLMPAGEDTAILTYHCFKKLKFKGDEVSGEFHVSAVYMKIGEHYKLLLWQITPFVGK